MGRVAAGRGEDGGCVQGGSEDRAAGEGLSQAGAGEQTARAEAVFMQGRHSQSTLPIGPATSERVDRRKRYLSTACWIRLIQLFRSSLELV